ncbi:MAG: PTS-dependent dihydroxyacetone kinase phosphotransferase subunit DhaM [Selenomonadaceae bacterium]|nr:PTS-dependent dihydroxyacetone kinase phosphotransferase subunit DhaM [Selenomonadaceae bacterium]
MVGIVVVSHSQKLAEGVVDIAKVMAENAPIAAAGGLEDGTLGTSYDRIRSAIESVYSEEGVVVIADLGGSIMTVEVVLEDMEYENIVMLDCPIVEGAILAAVESKNGRNLEDLKDCVERARATKKLSD